uniref:Caspase family p20 domain-containing protein n=1 Tax=Amblyomma maculatum TaxID=34609 RepID=G3MLK4_AMBMU
MGDTHVDGSSQTETRTLEKDAIPFRTGPVGQANLGHQSSQQISITPKLYNNAPIRRGRCVIFSNKVFQAHTNIPEREGADEDERSLAGCFTALGFDVSIYNDLLGKEITNELKKLGKDDYTEHDSFVCCLSTYDMEGHLYGSDGRRISIDEVMKPFLGDECQSLLGKPKLFFIQACRGRNYQKGVPLDKADSSGEGLRIPTHADFLFAYSTVPGFISFRYKKEGSIFVQTLCTVLQQYAHTADLLHMLTLVCQKVALELDGVFRTTPDGEKIAVKQMPSFMSTLRHLVYFSRRS